MFFEAPRARTTSPTLIGSSLLIFALLAGCTRTQTADQALDAQLKANNTKKEGKMAACSGQVRVDGQPFDGSKSVSLFVILNDKNHLDENAHRAAPARFAAVGADGKFVFHTYQDADGVPVGTYVATFVALHRPARRRIGSHIVNLEGPDDLKNLYNDPDKNATNPTFVLDLQSPGKSDLQFDLETAGKETVQPGPNAVTRMALGK